MHQLVQVKGNQGTLMEHMTTHEKTIGQLSQELKTMSAHHDSLIANLADKLEHKKTKVLTHF